MVGAETHGGLNPGGNYDYILQPNGNLLVAVEQFRLDERIGRARWIDALLPVRIILEKERSAYDVARKETSRELRRGAVGMLVISAMFRVRRVHGGVRIVGEHVNVILKL